MSKMCYLSLPTGIEITCLYCEIRQPSWAISLFHVQIIMLLEKSHLPSVSGCTAHRAEPGEGETTIYCSPDFCNSLLSRLSENIAFQNLWASDSTGAKEAILFNQLITKHKTYAGPLAIRTHWKVSAPTSILFQEFSTIQRHNVPCRFVLS